MWNVLGIPTTQSPLNVATFMSYLLPPLLCHFIMAVMAVTPRTRVLRAAFWPVLAWLTLRAAFSVVVMYDNSESKLTVSSSFGRSAT